jgi:hypothetical protein
VEGFLAFCPLEGAWDIVLLQHGRQSLHDNLSAIFGYVPIKMNRGDILFELCAPGRNQIW